MTVPNDCPRSKKGPAPLARTPLRYTAKAGYFWARRRQSMNAPTRNAPIQVTPPLVELQPIGRQIPPPRSMVPAGHPPPPPPPPAWPPETLASALAVRESEPALALTVR